MTTSHLEVTLTPEATKRCGLDPNRANALTMDDILDLIAEYHLVGTIKDRKLVIDVREAKQ